MNFSFDPTILSKELLNGHLVDAIEEMVTNPDKCLYQIGSEVRALNPSEAKTLKQAHLIELSQLRAVFNENMPKLEQAAQARYTKALSVYCKVVNSAVNVNEKQLTHVAETLGYGYKKANLDQASLLCQESFGSYRFAVPAYEGVCSAAIQSALNRCGLNLAERWQALLNKHYPTEASRQELLRTKKFSPAFLSDCAALQFELTESLKTLRQNAQNQTFEQMFGTPELDRLVENTHAKNERLMIRSSGKEDTPTVANAGGNTSVANVAPNRSDILDAFEKTLVSYFGERSLKARLAGNDESLFDPVPLTPVLVQRMIGERNPNALPKCGVLFTEDNVSKTNPGAKTSGITVINAAYGHNEGVVTGEIPVDRFYVNDPGTVFPQIAPKTFRMMPTETSGELEMVANDPKVANTPALSVEALQSLKSFAKRLERFYGRPMDVEFVVDEQEHTIYIVQTRPLVEKRFGAASYFSDLSRFKASEVLTGRPSKSFIPT